MSWRTKGHYRGLGDRERVWLKEFDRQWDTKSQGRSHVDAFGHLKAPDTSAETVIPTADLTPPKIAALPAPEPSEYCLETELASLKDHIARFTVPRATKAGWSIHLILKNGKRVRVHFPDQSTANQAYRVIREVFPMFLGV